MVVKCPICQVEVTWEGNLHRPFCSERCRLMDLGAWTAGRYRIPGQTLKKESDKDRSDEEEPS
ncbi:MAG: DNA gyrase inhibitor YacG [Deltaproteobacteria bacterium]|nr:DNA gyrase inhibitor YacG [Deltaproteobacteria bacterium]